MFAWKCKQQQHSSPECNAKRRLIEGPNFSRKRYRTRSSMIQGRNCSFGPCSNSNRENCNTSSNERNLPTAEISNKTIIPEVSCSSSSSVAALDCVSSAEEVSSGENLICSRSNSVNRRPDVIPSEDLVTSPDPVPDLNQSRSNIDVIPDLENNVSSTSIGIANTIKTSNHSQNKTSSATSSTSLTTSSTSSSPSRMRTRYQHLSKSCHTISFQTPKSNTKANSSVSSDKGNVKINPGFEIKTKKCKNLHFRTNSMKDSSTIATYVSISSSSSSSNKDDTSSSSSSSTTPKISQTKSKIRTRSKYFSKSRKMNRLQRPKTQTKGKNSVSSDEENKKNGCKGTSTTRKSHRQVEDGNKNATSISTSISTSSSSTRRIRSHYFSGSQNSATPRVRVKREGETQTNNRTNENIRAINENTRRTNSFDACWAGNLWKFLQSQPRNSVNPSSSSSSSSSAASGGRHPYACNMNIKIHTLILGTHPSVTSLSKEQYYAHPCNAFWWIAGDCLGFRRDTGISPSSQQPYAFTKYLEHSSENDIVPYEKQLEIFCNHGFALWDLIQSCERKGSLDVNIKRAKANNIRAFCEAHPSIRRIVFSNGQTQCKLFLKHFQDWWKEGDVVHTIKNFDQSGRMTVLVPEDNDISRRVFGLKYSKRIPVEESNISSHRRSRKRHSQSWRNQLENMDDGRYDGIRKIKCVCMIGVSPANASYSYKEKRNYWKKFCYEPGLRYHRDLNLSSNEYTPIETV